MTKKKDNISSEPFDSNITSGDHLSVWFSPGMKPIAFETLDRGLETDILVIGGGIAGLTTAYCLAKEGRKVVLIEDGYIGSGETGRTTAHLTCALGVRYYELEKTFDKETAQLVARSHMAAIEWIADTVYNEKIDCHFKRVDGYLFLHPSDRGETFRKEIEVTKGAGIGLEILNSIPGIEAEEGKECLKFPRQAQLHSLLYLKGLADAIIELGGEIYTQTKAKNISKDGATGNGYDIRARHIVVATNTPVNDWVTMHTKQWPYRTYVIGAKIPKGKLPYSLWWDTGDQDSKWILKPYHYVRLEPLDDQYDILISGGEDHRTAQADDENIEETERYDKLIEWTNVHFPAMETVRFKWSGQIIQSIDSIAFIGRNPGDENVYIITGDSGNGMTHGTLGGMIIKDLITAKKNQYAEIYDPSRITIKTTRHYLHEVGNMIRQYTDWLTPEDIKTAEELKPGEGAIISTGLKKLAIYRDEQNNLHTNTAVCPHLKGILHWNADEKTFDCPLHGSRFTTDGKVINGPATSDLKKPEMKKNAIKVEHHT